MLQKNKLNFNVVKSEVVFHGKVFDLRVDEIEYTSGNKGIRETAVHAGGAVVVAFLPDNKIVMIKQFRFPLEQFLLELPAGKLEKGEDPMNCATRELEEETGYRAGKIERLGSIVTSPGFCTEELHIFLATDLIPGDHSREEGEYGMEIHEFSMDEIDELILRGEIKDGKTLSGLLMAKLWLKK